MLNFPNAKINLGLNVVEKRPDGYHNLETIFYPIPLEDILEINPLASTNIQTTIVQTGLSVSGSIEDNLVLRAYRLLSTHFTLPPLQIHLHKHIPMGAGLGGGSSDAAYMLKMLNEKFGLQLSVERLEEYAALLGADCAFFIRNEPVYAEGIGNVFTPVELSLRGYGLIVIKPDVFVSTRDAFARISPRHPKQNLRDIVRLPVEEWKNCMLNDFEESVFPQFPLIGAIKEELYRAGAIYASMSGSGSSVYGLFAPGTPFPVLKRSADRQIYELAL